MQKKTKGIWKIKLGLGIVGKIELLKLNIASKNARKSQASTLRRILKDAQNTVYGIEHNFSEILKAKTAEELFERYRKEVKINSYSDFVPYIERHKNGEADVLFKGKPELYATTSGTTNTPKWIPITKKYKRTVFQAMNECWFHLCLKYRPHCSDGKCVTIVGKSVEGVAPDGTLYGSISGIVQRDIPNFLKVIYSAPSEIFHISDYKSRYYAIMRMGIMQNVTWIITPNPSTLIEMQNNVNEFFDEYVNDIEKGTISNKVDIPDYIREALLKEIVPEPERAAELRELKEKYGNVLPKHYWPNLQVISTWMCGNTNVYLKKIQNSFPDHTLFFEMAYFATEAKCGNVIDPHTKDTTLFCHKLYFEFILESEINNENPKVYQADELEIGKRYNVIVTTPSGLYRYDMTDIVTVTGTYNQFPKIQFLQKSNGIISLTGEKLSERQFIHAVHDTEKLTNTSLRFFVAFADVNESCYSFYYEFNDEDVSQEFANKFTEMIDENLKGYNSEWREKRNSNRIKDNKTFILQRESFETFKARCIDLGYRDGQFKLNFLMQDEKRHNMFKQLIKKISR